MSDINSNNFSDILGQLINLLPSFYNKEVSDTNYYRLLRSLALELSNAKIEVQKISDDTYLKTVSADTIYNNFGTLVKLKKNADWDDEKYRRLISGVMQSLLKGPTKQSLIDGLKLFTNFNVNVFELYKDQGRVDPTIYQGISPQFAFILEVEKPLESSSEQSALLRDANYIVSIIKPAHTINILITTLVGDESYRKWYRDRFNIDQLEAELPIEQRLLGLPDYFNMDIIDTDAQISKNDNYFGYHHNGIGVFKTITSLIAGTDVIGPKKILYDSALIQFDFNEIEYIINPIEFFDNILLEHQTVYDTTSLLNEYVMIYEYLEVNTTIIPNDFDHFFIDATNQYEEIYDFGASSASIFQLASFVNGKILGTPLDGQSVLSAISKDILIALSIDTSDFFNTLNISSSFEISGVNFEDIYTLSITDNYKEFNPEYSELVNLSLINNIVSEVGFEVPDYYNKSLIQHTITQFDILTSEDYPTPTPLFENVLDLLESINFLSKIDYGSSDSIANYYDIYNSSNYLDTLDQVIYFHSDTIHVITEQSSSDVVPAQYEEISTFVSAEELPRLTLNISTLNSARLGGTLRDQFTMVAG